MGENYTGVRVIQVEPDIINQVYRERKISLIDIDGRIARHLSQNEYCVLKFDNPPNSQSAITRVIGQELVLLQNEIEASGIKPRNKEQKMTLDALLDKDIKVVVLTGSAGTGKAQPLDARVLTPSGWEFMKDIHPNTKVLCPDGTTATVKSVHPQGILDIYRVIFSDGSSTECCLDHLWYTYTQEDRDNKRSGSVKTLEEIKETLRYGKARKRNHSIPMVQQLDFNSDISLELDPYLLGILIGDGSISVGIPMFSTADKEIIEEISSIVSRYNMKISYASGYDYRIIHEVKPKWNEGNFIKNILKQEKLWGRTSDKKFIPRKYLYTTYKNRVALLQGLLDSDGTIDKRSGHVTITTTSMFLSKQIKQLTMSLGGKAKIASRQTKYTYNDEKKLGKISYRVSISLPNSVKPFRLSRKQDYVVLKSKYPPRRYVDSIEFVGKKESQCIYIDHPDHLYITNNFIVTHNTLLALASALKLMDEGAYERLILTRTMSWVGKHGLGYLPGDVDEKFGPYLENYMCNIECLLGGKYKSVKDTIQQYRMDFVPLQLIRGASWMNALIIADEVQTLGYDEMVALGTRVGEDSKIIIMGDLQQRDEAIAREKTGMYKLTNSSLSRDSSLVASIDLLKCERSATSKLFADIFER